jgi:macrolide-specific efflux system membrane fusion protein
VIKKTLVLAAVGAAILLGAGWWLHLGEARTPGPVEAVVAQRGSLSQTVTALGKVEPLEFVDVGAQISGQIEKIHVQPGDRVEAGDLLVKIDATVYEAQVAADRATLRGLEAQLLEQNAMLKLADQRHRRNMQLYQAKAASREELESSAAESEAARARLAVLEAEIEKARSTLEANEANLGYTQIAAPMAGTVMSLDVRPGQTISARQTTPVLLRLANLDRMTVRAQVSEADVGKLRPGMEAYFTTLGEPDRRWTGKLRQVLPTPEVVNDVVLYHALFEVENADGRLLPQMTAQVFFVQKRAENAVLVPVAALRPADEPGRFAVEVIGPDGTAVRREVTVGLQDRVQAEIREGLAPGERVALPAPAAAPGGSSNP